MAAKTSSSVLMPMVMEHDVRQAYMGLMVRSTHFWPCIECIE